MSEKKVYNFGEKEKEFSAKQGKELPVWQSPKYSQSKEKAIELIAKGGYGLKEGDFWILMNETKNGKMAYTGLIISHNACLKVNDKQSPENKFKPECVKVDKEGYGNSLVYEYCSCEQGIFENGEVSSSNCKNAYPNAMALKRLFDRVVLKISKIAFEGIYSETEAEEFKEQPEAALDVKSLEQSDFEMLIQEAKTIKELVGLFNENQKTINGNKEILAIFTQRKNELQPKKEVKNEANIA